MSAGNLLDEELLSGPCVPSASPSCEGGRSDSEGSAVSCHGASSTVSTAVLAPTGVKEAPNLEKEALESPVGAFTPETTSRDLAGDFASAWEPAVTQFSHFSAMDFEFAVSPEATLAFESHLPLCALEPIVAPEVCDRGLEAAVAAKECQDSLAWQSKLQGPWETSRLGPITVVDDFVQCVTGLRIQLSLAADGRVALSNWRTSLQAHCHKLEWTRLDDPTGQELVLWERPVLDDESTATCLKDAQIERVTEEKCVNDPSKTRFDAFQGRWDTTQFGTLTVSGEVVRYDASGQSEEPLQLNIAEDGRVALLFWRAEVQPDKQSVRWTQDGVADDNAIAWVRLPDGAPARHVQLHVEQPTKPLRTALAKAKQRPSVMPKVLKQRDRAPSQRLSSRPTARKIVPAPVVLLERQELQTLKHTVDCYQGKIEKLKKKMKEASTEMAKKAKGMEKTRVVTRSKDGPQNAAASKACRARRPEEEAVAMIPSHAAHKRPRAKAVAKKASKKQKLEDTADWQNESATTKNIGKAKTAVQESESSAADADLQRLSSQQKVDLQNKIDELDDEQFDSVLAFLEPELGRPDDDEIRLDIDALSPARQHALLAMVNDELRKPQ